MSKKSQSARVRAILDDLSDDDLPPLPLNMSLREARMLTQAEADNDDPPDICHEHGKRKFATKGEAKRVIRFRQSRGAGRLRVYHCPECHRFHISSNFHYEPR